MASVIGASSLPWLWLSCEMAATDAILWSLCVVANADALPSRVKLLFSEALFLRLSSHVLQDSLMVRTTRHRNKYSALPLPSTFTWS
jgi:hypothetical protein